MNRYNKDYQKVEMPTLPTLHTGHALNLVTLDRSTKGTHWIDLINYCSTCTKNCRYRNPN